MSNVWRYAKGEPNLITAPVASATVVEIGDFLVMASNLVETAAQVTYGASLILTQEILHDSFLGMAMSQSRNGDTDDVLIGTSGVYRIAIASAVIRLGARIGADDNAGATALLDQQGIEVAVGDADAALGRVVDDSAAARTVCLVQIISTEVFDGPQVEA